VSGRIDDYASRKASAMAALDHIRSLSLSVPPAMNSPESFYRGQLMDAIRTAQAAVDDVRRLPYPGERLWPDGCRTAADTTPEEHARFDLWTAAYRRAIGDDDGAPGRG
jgi:hypothetical protein